LRIDLPTESIPAPAGPVIPPQSQSLGSANPIDFA